MSNKYNVIFSYYDVEENRFKTKNMVVEANDSMSAAGLVKGNCVLPEVRIKEVSLYEDVKEEWKERLAKETEELASKLNKLNAFMGNKAFYELPREKKTLLYRQCRLMNEYLEVLGLRCELEKIELEMWNK